MNKNQAEEHITKEILKKYVDNNNNFPEHVKHDLKALVDASKQPEELVLSLLTYFATRSSM